MIAPVQGTEGKVWSTPQIGTEIEILIKSLHSQWKKLGVTVEPHCAEGIAGKLTLSSRVRRKKSKVIPWEFITTD